MPPSTFKISLQHLLSGRGSYFDDLDGFPHGKLGLMANLVSSLKIDIGSCVEAYEYDPPGGEWFWTTETAIYQLDDALDNRISSLKSCGRYTVELHCPSGTFVKRIEWDGKNSLRGGLKLHCVPYSSTTVVSTLSLHDSLATTQAKDCLDAMRGIQFSRSNVLEVDYAMEPDCNPGYTYGNSIYCGSGSALIGVWMQVENRCVLLRIMIYKIFIKFGLGFNYYVVKFRLMNFSTLHKNFKNSLLPMDQ
ncbi:uncharacterized protein LOC110857291 [Folsomia candida]|uniref:uncharacterized protein LOC110857291 n=1 Tax=Folsomia candida TaxID=158441 RepID=UPI0016052238|nr:uncharacterized protein LOC110857291 [Folsomia candida]